MTDMDFININGKPLYFPGFTSFLDMPSDSSEYSDVIEAWNSAWGYSDTVTGHTKLCVGVQSGSSRVLGRLNDVTLIGFGSYGLRWVARETYGTEVCDD